MKTFDDGFSHSMTNESISESVVRLTDMECSVGMRRHDLQCCETAQTRYSGRTLSSIRGNQDEKSLSKKLSKKSRARSHRNVCFLCSFFFIKSYYGYLRVIPN